MENKAVTAQILEIFDHIDAKISEIEKKVDIEAITQLIESQIIGRKITLDEISSELKDFIEKYKRIEISIPALNFSVEIKADILKTYPAMFKYIDDVNAGNNIFFIGEAGSGKTTAAETIATVLKRGTQIINCSQYTSPIDIIGGQTIEGYKDGKLIVSAREGEILILDEMPKLDSNTAGLLNDALARTSKIMTSASRRFLRTARPSDPPVRIHDNFAVIATGNLYPNLEDTIKYVGNNKQDLSLLDRFSGSVYRIDYDENIDQSIAVFGYIYELCVKNKGKAIREILAQKGYTNYAVMSSRTIGAFRVALSFQIQAEYDGREHKGKTLWDGVDSYLNSFPDDVRKTIMDMSGITEAKINQSAVLLAKQIAESAKEGKPISKEYLTPFYSAGYDIKQLITLA